MQHPDEFTFKGSVGYFYMQVSSMLSDCHIHVFEE